DGSIPSTTALERRPALVGVKRVSTPSCRRKCKIKLPTWSSPTAVKRAYRRAKRRVPTLMFVGQPPTYAANLVISTKGTPMLLDESACVDRPMAISSYYI